MTADEILTAQQLAEGLQYEAEAALADRDRLTRARDGALAICEQLFKRPLLEASVKVKDCPHQVELYARRGMGLVINRPDVRDVTQVQRIDDDGEPVALTADELGSLDTWRDGAVQFLVEPVASQEDHTLTVDVGLADDSPLWPKIRQALIVVAGAIVDGQGHDMAVQAARTVLGSDPYR